MQSLLAFVLLAFSFPIEKQFERKATQQPEADCQTSFQLILQKQPVRVFMVLIP